jgi:hypothetical protein
MGCCKFHGHAPLHGYTKHDCEAAGGEWVECPTPSDNDTDSCFVTTILTRSLGQAILDLGKTYQSQIDFRDKVLASSPLGRAMITLYYKYNPVLLSVAMTHYELLGEAMKTWMSVLSFVEAAVAMAEGRREAVPRARARLKFTRDQYRRIVSLMDRFRAESDDRNFHRAMNKVKTELAGYVGLTPAEAVERLQRPKNRKRPPRRR